MALASANVAARLCGVLAALLIACAAPDLTERDRDESRRSVVASPSPGFYSGSCVLNRSIQINERRSPARSYVGGSLAANVNAAGYSLRSVDKSIWALRTATPPPELQLVRERLDGPAPTDTLVAKPIQHGDDSALPEWGPTYYVELRFPSAGCWRLRLRDGQPDDFIVLHVIDRP